MKRIQNIMLSKLFFIAVFLFLNLSVNAQKKEIAQARDNIKAGKQLIETEASMRKLLSDSVNRKNEKIWLILFDAIRKQYESVNEKMYLKQVSDTALLFATTWRMFGVLEGIDSIDALPDKSGRVKLKYRKRHSEYLNSLRINLYNGGLFQMRKKNNQIAFDYFAAYLDCATQPLFSAYHYNDTDKRLSLAAFYAVYNGYMAGHPDETLRYSDIAMNDSSKLDLVYQYMAETYMDIKDTIKYVEILQKGFCEYPRSDYFFSHLFDYWFKGGSAKKALNVCNEALAVDSLSKKALFAKSTVLLSLKQYEECIAISDKAISLDDKCSGAYLNAGIAYFNQAVELDKRKAYSREKRMRMLELYRKALPYMQTYRSLVPGEQGKWAMPLYTIYLNLNMGTEFEEIDKILKSMSK